MRHLSFEDAISTIQNDGRTTAAEPAHVAPCATSTVEWTLLPCGAVLKRTGQLVELLSTPAKPARVELAPDRFTLEHARRILCNW